jgi:serine/threonine-protein kinase
MTETNEIKTAGINLLVTGTDNGQPVLAIALKEAYREKPQHQKALQREYDKCHELEHPHLFKYLDCKNMEGLGTSLVLEWQPARTLDDYLHERHSVEECKRILRQIADAASYLHQNNMVHGALDGQSIFITTQDDNVKVLNFRMRYADKLHQPAESLKFIAPEAKDGTIALDARADIFSLGAIAKAMNLGPEYGDLVKGSCSYGRNERFDSTDAFVDALEHRRTPSRKASESDHVGTTTNKKMAVGIAVIVTLALIGLVWFFNGGGQDNGSTESQTSEVTDTTAAPAHNDASADAAPSAPTTDAAAPSTPAADATAQPADGTEQFTGDLAFLATLVPQMHIDIDKLYAKGGDSQAIHRRVVAYYKGLRGTLKGLNQAQYDAFDKAFADYITQKNAAQ